MSPIELDRRFDNVVRDMQSTGYGNIMASIASNALVTIRARVQEQGIDAEGKKFREYSKDPMLANCSSMTSGACGQIAGSKEKRRELKWVTLKRAGKNIKLFELPGGYKQYRDMHGRQTDHVDFTFNGRMWANIKVKGLVSEMNSGVARIGATEDKVNDILAGNTERRGDILKLSHDEIKDISTQFGIQLRQLFKKHGL